MGQKVNPLSLRLGINQKYEANWFANKNDFGTCLVEDIKVRNAVLKKFERSWELINTLIERDPKKKKFILILETPKTQTILDKKDENIKSVIDLIRKLVRKDYSINVEFKNTHFQYLSSRWIANQCADKLENRGSFKKLQKDYIKKVMMSGARGVKISIGGRLNGVDIARNVSQSKGIMPLGTLRSQIDFYKTNAITKYGVLGVKVWICTSENSNLSVNSFTQFKKFKNNMGPRRNKPNSYSKHTEEDDNFIAANDEDLSSDDSIIKED